MKIKYLCIILTLLVLPVFVGVKSENGRVVFYNCARIEKGHFYINNNPIAEWLYERNRKRVVTENKNAQWVKDAFAKHLKVLALREGKVFVESDGSLTITEFQGARFQLSESDEFYGHMGVNEDHVHNRQVFKLLRADADGIEISYEHKSYLTSIGDGSIKIDRGTVHVAWKNVGDT